MCDRCITLAENNQRLEQGMAVLRVDLENAQTGEVAARRKVTGLQRELEGKRKAHPKREEALEVHAHYNAVFGRKLKLGPAREKAYLATLGLGYDLDECKWAVDGLSKRRWSGPKGRAERQYPGSTDRFTEPALYIFKDEATMDRCLAYADEFAAEVLTRVAYRLVEAYGTRCVAMYDEMAIPRKLEEWFAPCPVCKQLASTLRVRAGTAQSDGWVDLACLSRCKPSEVKTAIRGLGRERAAA